MEAHGTAKNDWFSQSEICFLMLSNDGKGDFLDDHRARERAARLLSASRHSSILSVSRVMEAGMGDVVNLKRFKKRTEREQSAKQAESNRARYGRTKSQRALDGKLGDRARDLLDQHRIDGEDVS
jgi:Domain of unknown function (DUF4169)